MPETVFYETNPFLPRQRPILSSPQEALSRRQGRPARCAAHAEGQPAFQAGGAARELAFQSALSRERLIPKPVPNFVKARFAD